MKTYEQLMKHYWGVIVPMAEAAGINPWKCVRHDNDTQGGNHPRFTLKPYERYTFALTVLEGKPVWEGDEIYSKETGMKIKVMAHHAERYLRWESMTWTPPAKKRTFIVEETNDCNDHGPYYLYADKDIKIECRGNKFWSIKEV